MPDAVAADRAARRGVEGAAVAVGRDDARPPGRGSRRAAGTRTRHAAGQRHVALAVEQALAGEVDGHQRGRAGGLHGDARAAQVQLVGDAGGQEVLVVADHELEHARRRPAASGFGSRLAMQ